jgi:hypothetical protein
MIRSFVQSDAIAFFARDTQYQREKLATLERALPKLEGMFTLLVPARVTFDTQLLSATATALQQANAAAAAGASTAAFTSALVPLPQVLAISQPHNDQLEQLLHRVTALLPTAPAAASATHKPS